MDRNEREAEERADGAAGDRGRVAATLALLSAVLTVVLPSGLHADADGRADWREPTRAVDAADTSAGPRAADGARGVDAADATGTVEGADGIDGADGIGRADRTDRTDRTDRAGNTTPVLGGIGPQRLQAGRRWRLHVRARDPDGEPPRLLVRNLPAGATLAERRAGWYVLDWTPPADAAGVDLTIVAVDARDARLRSERIVRLELAPPPGSPPDDSGPGELSDDVPATDALSPDTPSADVLPTPEAPAVPRVAPRIEPLAAQVVSAGRTVAFKVAAAAPADESVPLLQIDRLPRNASFDRNADGSRTFHWPTGDSDQGEHRFRITALHPDDESLRSRVDLLVIVGDPTRAVTMPLDEGAYEAAGDEDFPPDAFVADGQAFASDGWPEASTADAFGPAPEDEPFLPRAESDEPDYFDPESPYPPDGTAMELPPEFPDYDSRDGLEPGLIGQEVDYFEPLDPAFDERDLPLGPDGLPFEP